MKIKFYISFILLLFAANIAGAFDLSLSDCRQMALDSDEDLKISENRLRQASLDRDIARTGYLPKFDGSATVVYRAPDAEMMGGMDLQLKGTYMAGINLTQPIFVGGKIITGNKLAKVGEDVAREQLRATRMDVIATAEKTYWMYVAVLAKIDMLNAYITQIDSVYDYTKSSYEVGLTTRLTVSRVETRRSEIHYRLQQAKNGADMCRMALCRVIGVADSIDLTPTEKLDDYLLPDMVRGSIDSRPELKLTELNIEAQKLNVRMAASDFLPTVGVQLGWSAYGNIKIKSMVQMPDGNYYPYTSNIKDNAFMGVLSVSVPLFHWGEGYRKVKKAKIEVENARLALEKNRRLMELDAAQSFNNYVDGYQLIIAAQKAFDEADDNLRMMQDRYEAGLMTLTDLLDAQSQWQKSYSNLIEAKTQYRIYQIEYLRSLGQLSSDNNS